MKKQLIFSNFFFAFVLIFTASLVKSSQSLAQFYVSPLIGMDLGEIKIDALHPNNFLRLQRIDEGQDKSLSLGIKLEYQFIEKFGISFHGTVLSRGVGTYERTTTGHDNLTYTRYANALKLNLSPIPKWRVSLGYSGYLINNVLKKATHIPGHSWEWRLGNNQITYHGFVLSTSYIYKNYFVEFDYHQKLGKIRSNPYFFEEEDISLNLMLGYRIKLFNKISSKKNKTKCPTM